MTEASSIEKEAESKDTGSIEAASVEASSNNARTSFNAWHYGLLVFLSIVFVNSSKLTNPPYWDDIIGLHNQAIFIAKHNFNPIELWKDKPMIVKGNTLPLATNSNVYPYSVIPWIHAVFYKILPPRGAHCAGHLFNMLCLSVAAALAYAVISSHQRRLTAALVSLLALLEPIMAGRTAALCMECPLATVTMLSFYFLDKGKIKFAFLIAAAAVFVKPSGVALLLVLAAFSALQLLSHWRTFSVRQRVISSVALGIIVVIGCFMLKRHLIFEEMSLKELYYLLVYRAPAILLYVGIMIVIATVITVYAMMKNIPFDIHDKMTMYRLCSLLFIWGMFFAMLVMPVVPPRYMTFCIFPIFVLIGIAIDDLNRAAPFVVAVAVLLLWHPMPKLPKKLLRSGEYLERSREYLDDLEANKIICGVLTKEAYQDKPAVVKWPFGQMLTMPEFGYVEKPRLNTYVADNIFPKYAPIIQADTYEKLPQNGVYLFTASSLSYSKPILLPEDEPKIVYKDDKLQGDAFIFVLK